MNATQNSNNSRCVEVVTVIQLNGSHLVGLPVLSAAHKVHTGTLLQLLL